MSLMKYQVDLEMLMSTIGAELHNQVELDIALCFGLEEDSRQIEDGYLFIARPGLESDGRRYINQAINRGAVAILVEEHQIEQFAQASLDTVPIYKITNLAQVLGLLADTFYQQPSRELTVIGITGTNGKTTCTQMTAHVLEEMGHATGVMGTMGNGRYGQLSPSANTTQDALSIHRQMAEFRDQGFEHVVMEVSSHALVQGRVNEINFDVAVFTNLTRDHLDYHGDMLSYANAKKKLFHWPNLKHIVINSDDKVGIEILQEVAKETSRYSFSITAINAQDDETSIYTESVKFNESGVQAEVISPWGDFELSTQLIGQFNLSNCLGVLTTLGALGYAIEDIISGIVTLKPVAGRMECFGNSETPLIVVDYAHTPDALKHALSALRPHTQHRLWCLVGCGGDRDRGKRPQMAAIAEEHSDYIVLTADNPRSEAVMDIINEMREGLTTKSETIVEPDRELAIQSTLSRAVIGDVVLVAGKGHEDYQVIGAEKHPYSDIKTVEKVLERGNWS